VSQIKGNQKNISFVVNLTSGLQSDDASEFLGFFPIIPNPILPPKPKDLSDTKLRVAIR